MKLISFMLFGIFTFASTALALDIDCTKLQAAKKKSAICANIKDDALRAKCEAKPAVESEGIAEQAK